MNPAMMGAMMQAGQGFGQLLGGLLTKWQNPADAAMPYMNQIAPNFNPYIKSGQDALPNLQKQYDMLTNNPGAMMNQMGQNFQQSPGYNFQLNQGMNAINHAAAAGGTLGTPMEQQNAANMAGGFANQDYYNWLNHSMNMYGAGLQGQQGMAQMGLQAGDDMSNALMSQANLAYAGAQNQNQHSAGLMSALGSIL
jgi:hypothetical protein